MPTPTAATARPVQLQLNNSGSWKTVARFDAGHGEHEDAALELVAAATRINPNYTWRIVTDETHPVRLMHWDSEYGWRDA